MATTDSSTEFSLDTAASLAEDEGGAIEGKSPWALAGRRLRRNYVALGFLLLFVLIVVACALAGPYAHHVAHTGPNDNHLGETFTKNGKQVQIVSKGGFVNGTFLAGGIPVGPQLWHAGGRYVFGADNQGRDVAVRLLYGGLNSLKVGIGSAVICTLAALIFALLAGYFGGWVDWVISRFFDLIWAFPVLLLAIALGTALSINGFHHFGINIQSGSLWIPTLVISYVLIPYIGRPLRGQILSLREKEFIEAATAQGASPVRVMMSELMPNIASSVMVFFTLIIANNILTEAGLSFLGAGVQPPSPSWGTLIADGQSRIVTAPWLAIIPGIAIVLTVLSLNIFGDGLRDALDPRAKVRMER
ncbi:MAG: peptide/nickel transport system permease protein [Gaiellaceae bacterium]|nr:peptide/nickel transport system permease protein [Gaiellaceae bacterium]